MERQEGEGRGSAGKGEVAGRTSLPSSCPPAVLESADPESAAAPVSAAAAAVVAQPTCAAKEREKGGE